MNLDRSEERGTPQVATVRSETEARKVWTQPSLSQLRAGSAENIPGSAFADGPLETIGS
ncbi:MAG TPA: hypothetical protein VFP12_16840 [Allosphingosinicella sp.]|nr:hypothetical protein [Allosphingosinicella sp.]